MEANGTAWRLAPVLALAMLAWAVLGWPWLSGRVTIPWDAKAQFQPAIQFLAQSLWQGQNPAWAPYVYSGHAQIADPQSMLFSPPFLLMSLVNSSPGHTAVDTTVLATILAGMAALIVFFRDRGWHWAGAVLAALSFGFGAAMAWRIQHFGQVLSLAYLPMVLVLLSRGLERGSWRYGMGAGILAAFLVLGRDQVALLCVYLLTGYVIAHWLGADRMDLQGGSIGTRLRDSLAPLLAGGIAGLAVVALPVLFTALAAEQSNRPAIDLVGAGRGSLHPALLVTLYAPDVFGSSGRMEDYWGPPSFTWSDTGLYIAQNMGQLYIGAIPVLLLGLGLVTGTLWRREIRFFTIALALTMLYALGWYTPAFALMHAWLPGVDYYRRPADAVFLIGALTAILSGYSAHRLFIAPQWRPSRAALLASIALPAAAFIAAGTLAQRIDRVAQAKAPFLVSLAIVAAAAIVIFLARRWLAARPAVAALAMIAFTVADLAWSNGPGGATALPPEHYTALDPKTKDQTIALIKTLTTSRQSETRRDRVELIGLGFHWPNASLTHGLEATLGYNPVHSSLYARATGAGDTAGSPGDRRFTPLFPSYRSPLANLLGLRFIAAGAPIETIDKTLGPHTLAHIGRNKDAWIYENTAALPRVIYATEARRADFEALIANGGLEGDFTREVLLEAPPPPAVTPRRPGTVRILSYAHTEVVVEADGPDGGFLVLNDLWHPWWRANIDGAPTELLRANVLFRAVGLPPGRHVVRFTFHPVSGALGDLLKRLRGSGP